MNEFFSIAEYFSYYWQRDSLELIVRLSTIISLIVAPIFYFLKKHLDLKSHNKLISQNICGELEDAKITLSNKPPIEKYYDDKKYKIVAAFLNHDIYDSLINSGQINFLEYHMQQMIQDIFTKIKDHNDYLKKLVELEELVNTGQSTYNEISLASGRYCAIIVQFENSLIKDIPKIQEKLSTRFNI